MALPGNPNGNAARSGSPSGSDAAAAASAAASSSGRGGATADREQNKAIRDWAKKAGKDISDRGRIPQEIVDEFHAKGPGR